MQTRLGRKVISHFIGEDGNNLLRIFKNLAGEDLDAKRATKLHNNILKLSVKVKMLNDKKLIRKRNFWHVVRAINGLAVKLYHCLLANKGRSAPSSENAGQANVYALANNFSIVRDMLVQILVSHLPPVDITSLVEILDYFGGEHFLAALVHQPAYSVQALPPLKVMVLPLLHGRRFNKQLMELCALPKCPSLRLVQIKPAVGSVAGGGENIDAVNGFNGGTESGVEAANLKGIGPNSRIDLEPFVATTFCQEHHYERFMRLHTGPNILHFLIGDGRDFYPMSDLVKNKIGRNIRRFYKATFTYEAVAGSLRLAVANEIWDGFLAQNAPRPVHACLPAELIATIQTRLEQVRQCVRSPAKQTAKPLSGLQTVIPTMTGELHL